jgi:hypothetical protein
LLHSILNRTAANIVAVFPGPPFFILVLSHLLILGFAALRRLWFSLSPYADFFFSPFFNIASSPNQPARELFIVSHRT